MDTRTPSPVPRSASAGPTAEYQPDLGAEVALLSTKLVNAINYQTNLDDALQHARHELEQVRKELAGVRAAKQEVDDMVARGVLVQRTSMDATLATLRAEAQAARGAREAAERAKKETEAELENLTVSLFEEANTMVAAARKDAEAAEKRNGQLRSQLADTEALLASQTQQLQHLKGVVERLERQSDAENPSGPHTPVDASAAAAWDALHVPPGATAAQDVQPDHPLHFAHLLAPVMRTDTAAYADFQDLLTLARRAAPHSRTPSSSTTTLSTASQTNLSSAPVSGHGAPQPPSLPGSFFSSANSSPSSAPFGPPSSLPPLKDSRFYKRILSEDLEPTLRLDLAPGLSFLSRRTVLSSLLSGSLVVEPFHVQIRQHGLGSLYACALCGESRKHEPYIRRHRFRTSEDDGAQRYPLCDWCVGRLRAACDLVGWLRMVREGYVKCEGEVEEKVAWEEAARLRERCFWARLGGGVVPAQQIIRREAAETMLSPESARVARASSESIPERSQRESDGRAVAVQQVDGEAPSLQQTEVPAQPPAPDPVTPDPTTPVEDAASQARHLHDDATCQRDQAEAEAQSHRESREQPPGPDGPEDVDAHVAREPEAPADMPAINEPETAVAAGPEETVAETPTPTPTPAPAVAPPSERRPSSVLARVKALEAAAGASAEGHTKLPGAFE